MNHPPKEKLALPYKVTPAGSLGLLALGYRGVMAWREQKNAAQISENES
jgi:hypothetical protein